MAKGRIVTATPAHQAFRDDAIALLRKHVAILSAKELLALAAHLVGQIIAMQDQRITTSETAIEIVAANIQIGNAEAIENLSTPHGTA